MEENTYKSKNAYGHRPLWQWIFIYLLVGALVYSLVYALFFSRGNYRKSVSAPSSGVMQQYNPY